MEYYLILGFFTLLIIILGWKIWKKTRSVAFIIGFLILYYWSLMGAWFVIFDKLTGKGKLIGLHYHYLFEKMFPVYLDNYYLLSIIYYSIFIITIQIFILLFLKKKESYSLPLINNKLQLHLNWLIIISFIAAIFSFVLIHKDVFYAIENNKSIYQVTRSYSNSYFTLHKVLNQVAIVPLLTGLVVVLGKGQNKFIDANYSTRLFSLFLIFIFIIESYLVFLGNKSEILFAGIFSFLFYLVNRNYKVKLSHLIILLFVVGIPLLVTDTIRSYSITAFFNDEINPVEGSSAELSAESVVQSFALSNELFGAHFSMYGVLYYDLPLTYGTSIISLIASLIPKIIWHDRPDTIYEYYATGVQVMRDQGYTINHVTAWYLNFGIPGILIGAIILGFIWSYFFRIQHSATLSSVKNKLWFLIIIVAFPAITAQLANLIRSGPEGYKGMIVDGILVPLLVLYFSTSFLNTKFSGSDDQQKT